MKFREKFIINIILYSLVFLLLFPLGILTVWSFTKRWPWPFLIPNQYSLRGFLSVFSSGFDFIRVIISSLCLSIMVTLIALIISIPAARALGVYTFKGKSIIKTVILAPVIIPTISVAMGIHVTFIRMGLANTIWGVILVHLIPCMPYGIIILADVFEIIGESMEMQAKILGANSVQVFKNITLPLITPGIVSAGSIVFIVSFSQYFLTFLIGGGRIITLPLLMFPFIQSGDRTIASVYSLIFIAISLIFFYAVNRLVNSYYKIESHFYI